MGSERRHADWYSTSCDGFPEGLRFWTDGNEIVLIDAPSPNLTNGLNVLLSVLGAPQEKLDSYLGMLLIEKSEWVYAGRGLTLYVNPENFLLLRIAVYPSISLTEYQEMFRMNLKQSRLPLSRNHHE